MTESIRLSKLSSTVTESNNGENKTGIAFLDQLKPQVYHNWRLNSEFHQQVELKVILELCQELGCSRILDLGCGTGLWSSILGRIKPNALILGVDISSPMISFAKRQHSGNNISFLEANCVNMHLGMEYDLIISALSADYIGFEQIRKIILESMINTGTTLVWYLNPNRYHQVGNFRIKRWNIANQDIIVKVNYFNPESVVNILEQCGLSVLKSTISFSLSDNIQRELILLKISKRL